MEAQNSNLMDNFFEGIIVWMWTYILACGISTIIELSIDSETLFVNAWFGLSILWFSVFTGMMLATMLPMLDNLRVPSFYFRAKLNFIMSLLLSLVATMTMEEYFIARLRGEDLVKLFVFLLLASAGNLGMKKMTECLDTRT